MINVIKRVFTIYLILFFINLPLMSPCLAAQRSVALVEVYDSSPSKNLGQMRHKIESFLLESKRVRLISADKIVAYFDKSSTGDTATDIAGGDKSQSTKGDQVYREAEDLNDAFRVNKAYEVVQVAIEELKKDCGRQGNLINAYLLKANLEITQGKSDEAYNSMQQAIALDVDLGKIDDYKYSPAMRSLYAKAYQRFVLENDITNFTVNIEGAQSLPIFVNGVMRGFGPQLTIKISKKARLSIAAGDKGRAKQVNTDQANVTLEAKGKGSGSLVGNKIIGIKTGSFSAMTADAVALGKSVGADQVILVKLDEMHPVDKLLVTVVDVRKGRATPPKPFEMVSVSDDGDKVAKISTDYMLSPGAMTQTTHTTSPAVPQNNGTQARQKKRGHGALIGAVIGVIAVGAGVGAVVALAGGGSSSTVTTSLSGPVPTAQ